MKLTLEKEIRRVSQWPGPRLSGRVTHVIGLLIESSGPQVAVGEICHVYGKKGQKVPCQVVGFKEQKVLLMALGDQSFISPGAEVYPTEEVHQVPVSEALYGRILNAMGESMDGKGTIEPELYYPVVAPPPDPLKRERITVALPTGVKAIDGLMTLGRGQRIGIFSGAGVGKSTLMGMIAKTARADVNVIALIGERGREVREFIERDLGSEGLARSIVVVATSDQPAPLRCKGANVAMAIAEYFRDQGKNVILMMDSVSRYAMALREMGLAAGELPSTRGYPPSVFALLPKLLERAGNDCRGSITGIYTILSEGDDLNDPIADQVRSLLDGHIVLSRALAGAAQFPPIDVLASLSRLMSTVTTEEHQNDANSLRQLMQTYKEAEDLIQIGAYAKGSNALIDRAIERMPTIREFLRQKPIEAFDWEKTLTLLKKALS